MNINLMELLESVGTIAGSALSAAAVVQRVLKGPLGDKLLEGLKLAVGQLVQEKLEAERPKLLESLRAQLRDLVRQETDGLRERVARLEGIVEGLGHGSERHNGSEGVGHG